jgi:hypothetical protein
MDHQEATRVGATEKYLLGTLDEAQRDSFEEHFFDCLECGADVRAATALIAGVRSLPQAIPDAPRSPASARAARRWWRDKPSRRGFLVAASGLAASLCFMAYQNGVVIPRLQEQAGRADSLQPVVSQFLTQTRGEATVIAVGPDDRHVALTLARPGDAASHRFRLEDASGRVLRDQTLPARSASGELEVLLPVANLAAGSYVLVVDGAGAAARFAFTLRREAAR